MDIQRAGGTDCGDELEKRLCEEFLGLQVERVVK
jgi:hypothetical protein